jgi:prepilin-type N-terminal cleavage/methylation domain-containing protein
MQRRVTVANKGFSLMEMMIAMALGAVVMTAAVSMFSKSLSGTLVVSQRAQMQQDFRAAATMLTKDASMAGAGMGNNVQIALPSGNGVQVPVYGCDQIPKCYINGGAVAYPTQVVGGLTVPYLYGLMPGWKLGPTVNAAGGATDVITVVNADSNFLLSCYNVTVISNTVARFLLPSPLPTTCVVPLPLLAPQAVNDPIVGLTPGDVVQLQVTIGVGNGATSSTVLGEVTNVQAAGNGPKGEPQYDVTFAAGDPLRMNQPGAAAGSLQQVINATGSGNRINIISYYIDNTIVPPRLMRQTSGHTPIPLAENVAFLQFSYDLYDSASGNVLTDQFDGGASQNLTPSQITKINIKHMSVTSTLKGQGGFQGLDLQTSVSARDLTFMNDYPLSAP